MQLRAGLKIREELVGLVEDLSAGDAVLGERRLDAPEIDITERDQASLVSARAGTTTTTSS